MESNLGLMSNTLQHYSNSTEYCPNLVDWFCIDLQWMCLWFCVQHSSLKEHNFTTKCEHKKYAYVFNTEKYTHINPGIYLAICNFLLPVTTVQIDV